MTLQQAPGFNATIDSSFAQLVKSQSLISKNNPLIGLRPSTLNLSQNCWTSCDLVSISQPTTPPDDPSVPPSVMSDIQSLASSALPNASMVNYMEYWQSLVQLDAAVHVLEDACTWCNTSGYLAMPVSSLDLTANCNYTGGFYSRYSGLNDKAMDYPDLVVFYTSILPAPYQNMTPPTIQAVAASMWDYSAINLPLVSPYNDSMIEAAKSCAQEACRGLEYEGDTDLGGIGTVATYFTIAAITTIFAFLAIHYKSHVEFDSPFRKNLRDNVLETSLMWWDAITWLTFITLLAAFVESLTHPKTLYEAVLTQWTVCLLLNAVNTLWALASYPEWAREKNTTPQKWVRGFIIAFTIIVALLSLGVVTNVFSSWRDWSGKMDTACYADGTWPLERAWKVATWFQACMPLLWLAVSICRKLIHRWVRKHGEIHLWSSRWQTLHGDHRFLRRALDYFEVSLSLGALWWNVASIWLLRLDAVSWFGPSYDDNSFTYGQMLAAGFAAQPVFAFFFKLFGDSFKALEIPEKRLRWLQIFRRTPIAEPVYDKLSFEAVTPEPPAVDVDVPSGYFGDSWSLPDYQTSGDIGAVRHRQVLHEG